ncbi:MAG: Type IV pilus assembly protein PilM [Candidatus Nomurabacteria bacterium GW2011_GWA2_40_9]|uniref:Type IV pilus assembly protein PilM n=1 Tax=Candidatus Nomurabacteria bacterium GW2011_GWA2_40_9 TaxID=1618734 RepID=A0A0G0TWW2_9BACT|nr:MAG: Type IV pilus assembly protein PilM [Candidatus Nomurabacteria bacterium GW2011_GWA2_40_9]
MIKNSYNIFFPTPDFLSRPSFGIDISDESLKYIQLISDRDGIRASKYGEKKIPPGIIEAGRIIDPEKIQEILMSLRKAALEAIFDYEIIEETKDDLDLQVVAIPKGIIESYLAVFKDCDILVHSFELEAQAIARSVIPKGDTGTYMIVDFGEKRTGIFIISHGVVSFTSTLDVGGVVLNKMIQKNFKVGFEEANKMKKEYGLERNAPNKEIFSVLLNSVSILRDELVKHFTYWDTHKDEEGRGNPSIKKIFLCGGDSNLIGLADYLSVSMKTEVSMANVWVNILDTEKYIPTIPLKQALSFAAAIGLALGDFENE